VTIDKWAVAIEPFEDEAPSFYRWPAYEVRHMPSMNSNACTSGDNILSVGRREIVS